MIATHSIYCYQRERPVIQQDVRLGEYSLFTEGLVQGWFLKLLTRGALGSMQKSACGPFAATPMALKTET